MFLVSKLAEIFLLPSNLIGFVACLGVVAYLLRWRRVAATATLVAALLIAICGWLPIGRLALAALEDHFPKPLLDGQVAGIVMLGGAVDTHITAERKQPTLNEAGERITATAQLSRRFPNARLLLSGGASDIFSADSKTESAIAKELLVALGVPEARIELDERSRTTCENAEQSFIVAKPVAGERWLLVTSASHMPRAVACFRAAGFPVIPYPVDYRTRATDDIFRPEASISNGLAAVDLAAHEWLGLAVYRLRGQTQALFPPIQAP